MKKVCLIIPKGLPVPNVLGGAVEELATELVNENEKDPKMELTIVSLYDPKVATIKPKKYTNFIYIKYDLKYKLKSAYVHLANIFGAKLNTYNEVILDKIKDMNFDVVVAEDGAIESFYTYLKYYTKEQLMIHFHHVGDTYPNIERTFGTFIGCSHYVTKRFQTHSHIQKCVTLLNGIDTSKFSKTISTEEKHDMRKKLGFKDSDFVIYYCGRLLAVKGVMELVKAVKSLDKHIKLVIIGSIHFGKDGHSDFLDSLKQEIDTSNGQVVLTGYIPNQELYKYMKMSDLAIIPSLIDEAFALTLVEAMVTGLPTIITDSGGMMELASASTIIIKRDNNLITNLALAINNLSKNKPQLAIMSQDNLKQAKPFTAQTYFKNYVKIINGDKNE